jgi:hypothetical protein
MQWTQSIKAISHLKHCVQSTYITNQSIHSHVNCLLGNDQTKVILYLVSLISFPNDNSSAIR